MANQTIYPYGPDGQLPSGVGIINDLTTGGANKALSAEMGKAIGVMNETSSTGADLCFSDEDGNEVLRLKDGHIRTKNFNSEDRVSVSGRTLIIK